MTTLLDIDIVRRVRELNPNKDFTRSNVLDLGFLSIPVFLERL